MKKFSKINSLLLILLSSLLYQITNIIFYKNRFYGDAVHELTSGLEFLRLKTHVFLNSKCYFTTVLNSWIYENFGALGVKGLHVVCFVLLFFILINIGKRYFPQNVVTLAIFLFSYYPGTSLNVIANETADMMYALIFVSAVMIFLRTGKAFVPSTLMGVAFLFKYITGIFFLGFLVHLTSTRRSKCALSSSAGFALPLLATWMIDPLLLKEFIDFIYLNVNYTSWLQVIFKLFSTGMLPIFLIALMEFRKRRTLVNQLFFLIPLPYLIYAIASKNAYSSSYIMSFCMMFLSFLVASFLQFNEYCVGKKIWIVRIVLVIYTIGSILIVQRNLHYDTVVADKI